MKPLVFASAGLGGYAASICNLLSEASAEPEPAVRLHAVCEPNLAAFAAPAAELRARGVKVFESYAELLAEAEVEAVWLPLPIHLHRPFTEQALHAGKHVLCEKPAAGSIQDVRAMADAADAAGLKLALGFQDIYLPYRHKVKQALAEGRIGTVRRGTLWASWPRGNAYFARNAWAGALKRDDTWVLDSPANNALAHFVNLAMDWLSPTPVSARPLAVEAELYRANPIENYDTCSLRVQLEGDRELVVLLTHAGRPAEQPRIEIVGDAGRVRFHAFENVVIDHAGGHEQVPVDDDRTHVAREFARWVRGEADASRIATIDFGLHHTLLINAVSEAAPVVEIPAEARVVHQEGEAASQCVPGLVEAMRDAAAQARLLHETGRFDWTSPASCKRIDPAMHFAGPFAG
ncbi:MAG: Gfo/Idh/MocA family protein [Phycisphaerae bacterium]